MKSIRWRGPSQITAAEQSDVNRGAARTLVSDCSCPFCRGRALKIWAGENFWSCMACDLRFRHPLPSSSELDALYGEAWRAPENHRSETGATDGDLADLYTRRLVKSLGGADLSGQVLLDFGAGGGDFSVALRKLGAEVHAVDAYSYEHLRSRGITAHRRLSDIPTGIRFDGIVSVEVIEHLVQPWQVLSDLRARLTSGGWLYVSTPNASGLNARLMRKGWREAAKPGHVVLFTPASLELTLRRAGFQERRLRWFVGYSRSRAKRFLQYSLQMSRLEGGLRSLAYPTRTLVAAARRADK